MKILQNSNKHNLYDRFLLANSKYITYSSMHCIHLVQQTFRMMHDFTRTNPHRLCFHIQRKRGFYQPTFMFYKGQDLQFVANLGNKSYFKATDFCQLSPSFFPLTTQHLTWQDVTLNKPVKTFSPLPSTSYHVYKLGD